MIKDDDYIDNLTIRIEKAQAIMILLKDLNEVEQQMILDGVEKLLGIVKE